MNVGFYFCLILSVANLCLGLIFSVLKGKVAFLIAGYNNMPKEERDLYDKEKMSLDMRNMFFLWSLILGIGAAGSYVISPYIAIFAFVIWFLLFIKKITYDNHKGIEKYRLN